ncbi:hypothetical protein J6590_054613 [Homalodisca vitripennis]|nr:hypothetical protein J6590_054613 [Homalodisca vitripennis]
MSIDEFRLRKKLTVTPATFGGGYHVAVWVGLSRCLLRCLLNSMSDTEPQGVTVYVTLARKMSVPLRIAMNRCVGRRPQLHYELAACFTYLHDGPPSVDIHENIFRPLVSSHVLSEEGKASSEPASPVKAGRGERTPPTPTIIYHSRLDLSNYPCAQEFRHCVTHCFAVPTVGSTVRYKPARSEPSGETNLLDSDPQGIGSSLYEALIVRIIPETGGPKDRDLSITINFHRDELLLAGISNIPGQHVGNYPEVRKFQKKVILKAGLFKITGIILFRTSGIYRLVVLETTVLLIRGTILCLCLARNGFSQEKREQRHEYFSDQEIPLGGIRALRMLLSVAPQNGDS